MILFESRLLFITLLALSLHSTALVQGILTCNNCRDIDCEGGSCSGDVCLDELLHNSKAGATYYNRGCLIYLAGGPADTPTIRSSSGTDADFSCNSNKNGDIIQSVCECQSGDKCNSGRFNIGPYQSGPMTCDYGGGAEPAEGHCSGDRCFYDTSNVLGVGCQYFTGDFISYGPKTPPKNFEGCFKTNNSRVLNSELCVCKNKDLCNDSPGQASYDTGRSMVTCTESKPFDAQLTQCLGHACYLTGANISQVNALERGCLFASGISNLTRFCTAKYSGDSGIAQVSCICTDDDCNESIDAAIKSMQPSTTTAMPTTSAAPTTPAPSTTTKMPTTTITEEPLSTSTPKAPSTTRTTSIPPTSSMAMTTSTMAPLTTTQAPPTTAKPVTTTTEMTQTTTTVATSIAATTTTQQHPSSSTTSQAPTTHPVTTSAEQTTQTTPTTTTKASDSLRATALLHCLALICSLFLMKL